MWCQVEQGYIRFSHCTAPEVNDIVARLCRGHQSDMRIRTRDTHISATVVDAPGGAYDVGWTERISNRGVVLRRALHSSTGLI